MWLLRNWSIKSKLILLSTVSGVVALVLACSAFVINEYYMMRDAKLRQLQSMAQILGYNSSVGLISLDKAACDSFLNSLEKQPSVKRVCLYAADGTPFAVYPQSQSALFSQSRTELVPTFGENATGELEVFHPIFERGHYIGGLLIQAGTEDIDELFVANLHIAGTVMFACVIASFLFSCLMQQRLTAPILTLADAAAQIERESDYSIRVTATTDDEIATLYDSFNRMVDQIEASKASLEQANARLEEAQGTLERRVLDRTRELQQEINTRARIQEELERAKDAAETANKAKSEFLANMSHEIRTPLNAILGFASLMRDGVESESERLDFLNTIQNGGQHLISLVDDVLDLSKIEAGQMEFDRTPTSPHQIISEIMSVLRVRAKEKGLSLEYKWASSIPATISTDPGRLRQVLINLIGNALKFTEHGGVCLVAHLDAMQEQLVFDVVDTGIGIPEHQLETIFDPFSQADTSVTRRFGGTGLGLSICRHFATVLGGHVSVTSEVGKGSVFTLRVATGSLAGVAMHDEPDADILYRNSEQTPRKRTQLPRVKILAVDDGDTNRKLIQYVLDRAGAHVVVADNGKTAVDLAREQSFDLILMDMQMPILDGYTATQTLRAAGLTIPIIALTAHAMREDEDKCIAAGCSGYLTKPIDSERLVSILASILKCDTTSTDGTTNAADSKQNFVESTLLSEDSGYLEIVQDFTVRLKTKVHEMWDAFSRNEMQHLALLAHWLKGTGGTAGFNKLSEHAAVLESAVLRNDVDGMKQSLSDITSFSNRIHVPEATLLV